MLEPNIMVILWAFLHELTDGSWKSLKLGKTPIFGFYFGFFWCWAKKQPVNHVIMPIND
jgi:hypothetical protein